LLAEYDENHASCIDINVMKDIAFDNEEYLKQLVDRYYNRLCVVAVQYTDSLEAAEDIVQDVFLRFWQDKKMLRVETNAEGYLFRSVRNAAIDYIRKTGSYIFTDIEEATFLHDEEIDETDLATQYEHLHTVLSQLPAQEYQVLISIVVDNKHYKEVAEEMGISVNTVKTHFARALKYLRNELPLTILILLLSPK
jgi:RNA polymerase sigma-70 factor (family 1)